MLRLLLTALFARPAAMPAASSALRALCEL
jgi:hypothetical protein